MPFDTMRAVRFGDKGNVNTSSPHSRPYWSPNLSSYEISLLHPNPVTRKKGDFGLDNFAYDPVHMPKWQIHPGLRHYLTPELNNVATNWTMASAAVCTSIERIESLRAEALTRTDPPITHQHIIDGLWDASEVSTGVNEGTPSSPVALAQAALPPLNFALLSISPKLCNCGRKLMQAVPQLPSNILGMDTPPFTPLDSKVDNTPQSEPFVEARATAPNLKHVDAQLSPLSPSSRSFNAAEYRWSSMMDHSDASSINNGNAWEFYLNNLKEELHDLRVNAIGRLRGYDDTFRMLCVDHLKYGKLNEEMVKLLLEWWKGNSITTKAYAGQAKALEQSVLATAYDMAGDDVDGVDFVFNPPKIDTRYVDKEGKMAWW